MPLVGRCELFSRSARRRPPCRRRVRPPGNRLLLGDPKRGAITLDASSLQLLNGRYLCEVCRSLRLSRAAGSGLRRGGVGLHFWDSIGILLRLKLISTCKGFKQGLVGISRNQSIIGCPFKVDEGHFFLGPHTSGPRDVARCGALCLLQKTPHYRGGSSRNRC
jgi:hypothetical protein